jgi:transglutaminase-like putative cysteine protease
VTDTRRASLRLAAAAGLATAAATIGLERLVQTGSWISICFVLILVVGTTGHLVRTKAYVPRPVVIIAQLAASLLALTLLRAADNAVALILPGPGALRELAHQVADGRVDISREAPPAAATPGITTILAMVCAAFAILIDAVAVTYRRAVLAGLPLLAVYLIPATQKPGGLSWLAFAVSAIGYLSLVSAEGHDRLSRWGRSLGGPARMPGELSGPANNPHSTLSRRITTTALAAALIVPWFVPTLPGVFKTSGGIGIGAGSGTFSIDQTIDLRTSLTSTDAVPLLQYTTNSANARSSYLQMSVLDKFDGNSWTSSSTPANPLDANASVSVPGLTTPGIKQASVTTKVKVVADFGFNTVPAPYAPMSVSGISNPSYDPRTLEIAPGDSGTHSRYGQEYTVTSNEVTPTPEQLSASSGPFDPSLSQYLKLPADFPQDVRAKARQITAGGSTEIAKAVALQNYFLSGFTYSLSVPSGDGNSAIETFLKDRVGFCQQFAGTMTAMARSLGIPAVVAVGFTPGTPQQDGSYKVTTHDAHSWPMLYFNGVGWVRFEPTTSIASSGRGSEPSWARLAAGSLQSAQASTSAQQSASPIPSDSAAECAAQVRKIAGGCQGDAATGAASARPFASWGPFGTVPRSFQRWFLTGSAGQIGGKLTALLLVLLATAPAFGRLVRRRKRRVLVKQAERYLARAARGETDTETAAPARVGRQQGRPASDPMTAVALAAWAELRECADDLGYAWVDADTPRQAASRLKTAARLDDHATAAIGRVTTLTEEARYAHAKAYDRPALHSLPGDLRTLRAALAEHASRANRIRAAILPPSSLSRLREGRDRFAASISWRRAGRRHDE